MRVLVALTLVGGLLVTSQAEAQSSRYSSWGNPDTTQTSGSAGDQAQLIKTLRTLIDEAEKARAADPVFLKDLRETLRAYETPWGRRLVSDAFADGDFDQNPAWKLVEGKWWVEDKWGLRSAIEPGATTSSSQNLSGEDAAVAILGAILNQAAKNKSGGTQGKPARAVIALPQTITNAFSIELEFTSWQPKGRFEAAVYQGSPDGPGYRFAYMPGRGAELLRVTGRGSGVIDSSAKELGLEDQKSHSIVWSRTPDGMMSLSVDGTKVLSASDRAFSDPFDGLSLGNEGGDYIIKSVTIYGTD